MLDKFMELDCPDCGKKIKEQDEICPHCGANLDAPIGLATDSSGNQIRNMDLVSAQKYLEKAKKALDKGSQLDEALTDSNIAIQYNPDSAEAHNLHGLILDSLGHANKAVASYREALRLDPFLADARANLADAEREFEKSTREVFQDSEQKKGMWSFLIKTISSFILILCVIAGGGLLYDEFGRDYFAPKATITIKPDPALVIAVDPRDLEKTAHILTERSHALGYWQASFVVSDNGEIIGNAPATQAETLMARISAIGLLEFVDFGNSSVAQGEIINTDFDHTYLPQAHGQVWHTVITNAEMASSIVTKDGIGQDIIAFSLTEAGTKIFYQHTSTHIGSYLGIVMDKIVVSVPIIQSAISDGRAVIKGNFTKDEMDNFAVYIRMPPLPMPIIVTEISIGNQ
jgi:zinc-ribbon domain/Tetratricopeptide repeat